jgi:hypothetical protein
MGRQLVGHIVDGSAYEKADADKAGETHCEKDFHLVSLGHEFELDSKRECQLVQVVYAAFVSVCIA